MHGRPWVAWQMHAANLIGEQLPNGRYAFPTAIVLVPRQAGKTTFAFDLALGRALAMRGYQAAYTAQTGHVTTERFAERTADIPRPLARLLRPRRSQGTERIAVPSRGSFLKAFPPKDGALRGSALDLVIVDEAQEISAELGEALDRTIVPTFATRPRRQLILIGTAGSSQSAYLRRYLDAARDGAPGHAVLEYGAPDGTDPADEAAWAAWHPGLAAGLTDVDALRQARAMIGDAGFSREYLNIWTIGADLSPLDPARWAAAAVDPFPVPPRVHLAFDVAADGSDAAIAAAWRHDGRMHVRLLEHRAGAAWLRPRLDELAAALRVPIGYDEYGPAVAIAPSLARETAARVSGYGGGDYTAACMAFAADLDAGRLSHAGQPPLDLAAAAAQKRRVADRWVWDRRVPQSMAPLIAATVAARMATQSQPSRRPVVAGG